MTRYVVDTVALIHYFAGSLPSKADEIFKMAEEGTVDLMVPSICVGEFIYVVLKQKGLSKGQRMKVLGLLLDVIASVDNIIYTPLRIDSWRNLVRIDIPELHDRIVVATCIQEKGDAIITNDPEIQKVASTVW